MLVFRSLTLGLLGACFMLLMSRPAVQVVRVPVAPAALPQPITTAPTIIDVAPGVEPAQLAALIRLEADERITSIDDTPISGNLQAGVVLGMMSLSTGRYIDVGVSGSAGSRRMLVLLH